jgi:hypothetical protein
VFATVEVRWFRPGAVPADVLSWYLSRTGQSGEQESRTDFYFRSRDGEGLGVKLREGRIEIKQRQRRWGVVPFGGDVAGQVEGWMKWSFELARAEEVLANIASGAEHWVSVSKERKQRAFALTPDRKVTHVSEGKTPQTACVVELASVRVAGTEWWSLAFEAYGETADMDQYLIAVAEHTFASGVTPRLNAEESFGYPKLLQVVRG